MKFLIILSLFFSILTVPTLSLACGEYCEGQGYCGPLSSCFYNPSTGNFFCGPDSSCGYIYPTPSYGTPYGYPTPSYGTPAYGSPYSYPTPVYSTPVAECGNGICDSGESATSCPSDCSPYLYPTPPSDTTPPTISNGQPIGTVNTNPTTISVSTNEIATCKFGFNFGDSYDAMPYVFSSTGSASHSSSIATSDGSYTIYVKCRDSLGNTNGVPYTISFTKTTPDTTPPTGSIIINNGVTSTNTLSVTLALSCSDSSGCSQMKISNTFSGLSSAIAESYTTSKSWTLQSGSDGSREVYVVYRDNAGNWMPDNSAVADTIALSTVTYPTPYSYPTPPTCTPNWSCSSWSPTTSSQICGATFTQTRTCTDLNNCGTTSGKPSTSQPSTGSSCGYSSQSCIYSSIDGNYICSPSPGEGCNDANSCTTGDVWKVSGSSLICSGNPILCNAPPANICIDSNTLRTYTSPGTCGAGACSYSSTSITCANGCSNNQCNPTPGDTSPPVRSAGQPSGTISTTTPTMSLATNEAATCRYSSLSTLAYDDMTGVFQTTGGTTHSHSLSLSQNSYTFYVKCKDSANNKNTDNYPISFTIKVPDTTPPDTTITSGPSGTVSSTTATFTYTSTESGSTFNCKLDGGKFSSCPSTGITYSNLAQGVHTFEVNATDSAGNPDLTPATRTWTISNTPVPPPKSSLSLTQINGLTVYSSTHPTEYSTMVTTTGIKINSSIKYREVAYNEFYLLFDKTPRVILSFKDDATGRSVVPYDSGTSPKIFSSSLVTNINLKEFCPSAESGLSSPTSVISQVSGVTAYSHEIKSAIYLSGLNGFRINLPITYESVSYSSFYIFLNSTHAMIGFSDSATGKILINGALSTSFSFNEICPKDVTVSKQLKDYPKFLFTNNVIDAIVVSGSGSNAQENSVTVDVANSLGISTKIDLQISEVDKGKNLILVGTPCTNSLIAELSAKGIFRYSCENWPGENFGILEIVDNAFVSGKVALIVGGTRIEDLQLAGAVLRNYATLLGSSSVKAVKTTGTSVNDVVISTQLPTPTNKLIGPSLDEISGQFEYRGIIYNFHTTTTTSENSIEYRYIFDKTISDVDFNFVSPNIVSYQNPVKVNVAGKEFSIVAIPTPASFTALTATVKTLSDGESMTVGDLTFKVVQSYPLAKANIEIIDPIGVRVALGINTGTTESVSYGGSTYNYKVLSSSATASGVAGYSQLLVGKGDIEKTFDGSTQAIIQEWGPSWSISGIFATAGRIQSGDFIKITNEPIKETFSEYDLNKDHKIDGNDMSICFRCYGKYNSFYESTSCELCDYNGDHKIDDNDIEILAKRIPPLLSFTQHHPQVGKSGTIFTINIVIQSFNSLNSVVMQIILDGRIIDSMTLYDDGFHGDENPNDNKYGNMWDSSNRPSGSYLLKIIAKDSEGNTAESLSKTGPLIFSEEICEPVLINGNAANKIDVVLVASMYNENELDKFKSYVVPKVIEGLTAVEPFKSNKEKFNFYYVALPTTLNCEGQCSSLAIRNSNFCSQRDQIINLGPGQPTYASIGGYFASVNTDFLENSDGVNVFNKALLHEFGHSFGDLRHEGTVITNNELYKDHLEEIPNCDANGCRKWCSGEIIYDEPKCYEKITEDECLKTLYSYDGVNYNCKWAFSYEDNNMICEFPDENINFGSNCIQDAGCFHHCGETSGFRSTFHNTIMSYTSSITNPIAKNAINGYSPAAIQQLNKLLNNYR